MRLTVTPTNTVGWFTITVGLWAGLSGAVPLWVGAVVALAGVPAASWNGGER